MINKNRIKDLSIVAIVIMVVQMLVSKYIYPLFGGTVNQLFSVTPQTVITSPTIGNKVLGFISGIIPIELGVLTNWVAIFIGAFALLIVGYWVYDQKWAYKGKNVFQRLWFILLYGTGVLYVLLLATNIEKVTEIAVPLLIGVGLNYLIIAGAVSFLAQRLKFLRI